MFHMTPLVMYIQYVQYAGRIYVWSYEIICPSNPYTSMLYIDVVRMWYILLVWKYFASFDLGLYPHIRVYYFMITW